MKTVPKLFIAAGILLLSACKKDNLKTETEQVAPAPVEEKLVGGDIIPSLPGSTIIHRSVNMKVSYNKHILLDVDADGQPDFNFSSVLIAHDGRPHLYLLVNPKTTIGARVMVQTGPEMVIYGLWTVPLTANTVIGETPTNNNIWTESLMKGFIIDSSKDNNSHQYNGLWVGKTDQYLGIKFKTGTNLYFGWVKLSHQAGTEELVITDYAYNTVAGQNIQAGQIN